jgi:hypothetical protein
MAAVFGSKTARIKKSPCLLNSNLFQPQVEQVLKNIETIHQLPCFMFRFNSEEFQCHLQ